MEACSACRQEFGRLQSVDRLLAGIKTIEPSSQFEHGFWKKINAIKEKNRAGWQIQNFVSWAFRPSLAVIAAVTAIFAGIMFVKDIKTPRWNPVELSIASDLEFYRDMDMIDHLDLLENWDEIMSTRESAL
jgi:hypothetical protein